MKPLFKEPLLHFLLLGALIFAVYTFVYGRESEAPGEIVVTEGQIANLVSLFARTWQRPPSEVELEGIIREYIRGEVAYREALALGLDRDDTVVRRRLRQKLEFIAEDLTNQTAPTEAQLREYLAAHPNVFLRDPSFTFRHIYFSADRRGDTAELEAQSLLATLQQSESDDDPAQFGDSFLLGHEFTTQTTQDVASSFGEDFAAQLAEIPTGRWAGPLRSGYGFHLVHIAETVGGEIPPFEEIRGEVEREWTNARTKQATEDFYAALLKRYTVSIEPPTDTLPTPPQ